MVFAYIKNRCYRSSKTNSRVVLTFVAAFLLFSFFETYTAGAGELLHNGDFEQGEWIQLCGAHFHTYAGPNTYPVLHTHAIQDFIEPLSKGIDYVYSFEYAGALRNPYWKNDPVMGDLRLMILKPSVRTRYSHYFEFGPNENWIGGAEKNVFSINRDGDRKKLLTELWNTQTGPYTGEGGEFYFILESEKVGIIAIDNASLKCTPDALFEFVKKDIYPKNNINWQIGKPGQLVVKPEFFWNAIESKWIFEETDEYGVVNGPLKSSQQVPDQPWLKNAERFDSEPFVPAIPPGSVRYFMLTHWDRCQNKPSTFEKTDFDYVIVERELKIDGVMPDFLCSDPNDFISVPYTLTYETIQNLTISAELYRDKVWVETIKLDPTFKTGIAKFKNEHIPGSYHVHFVGTSKSIFGGTLKAEKNVYFKIKTPQVSIQGQQQLVIGRNGNYHFNYEGAFSPTNVNWSYQDETSTWLQDPHPVPAAKFDFSRYWIVPGKYSIGAKAVWYHQKCFAEAVLPITVIETKPIPSLQIDDVPCSNPGDLSVQFTLDDQGFKINSIQTEFLDKGKMIESMAIDPQTLDPSTQSKKISFKNPIKPGDYQIKISISYEIIPSLNKTVVLTTAFKILPPVLPSLTGPPFLKADTEGNYGLGFIQQQIPSIQWQYQDEFGYQWGNKNSLTQKLKWKERGTYEVIADLEWSQYCKGTVRTSTRVVIDNTIYAPNAFTSNNDGLNETFGPHGYDTKILLFEVFNRWGERVYKVEGGDIEEYYSPPGSFDVPPKAWDGFYQRQLVQEGVYAFRVIGQPYLPNEKGEMKPVELNGTVTLVR